MALLTNPANSKRPSGSMEPGFFRGDLLFLWLDPNDPIEVGDITVFKLQAREIPIVHRVIEVHDRCVFKSASPLNSGCSGATARSTTSRRETTTPSTTAASITRYCLT